jgi:hypothetical protein
MKISVLSLALLWAASCSAQGFTPLDVKLGLWETKASVETGAAGRMQAMPQIPPEALAKMPPEQRARMEEMLKAGSKGGPMVTTTKVCMTKESLADGRAFARSNQKGCTTKIVTSTASKQQIHIECDNEGAKTTGDMTVDRVSAEHIKGLMNMQSVSSPRPVQMKMSFDTRWISSDCGDVKPHVAR